MLSTAIRSDNSDMQLLIIINRPIQTSTTILTAKQLVEEMDLNAKLSNREMHKRID